MTPGRHHQRLEQHHDQRHQWRLQDSVRRPGIEQFARSAGLRRIQPSVEAIRSSRCRPPTSPPSTARWAAASSISPSKSGTNQFHGSVYIYLQNTAFNAGIPSPTTAHGGHVKIVKHLAERRLLGRRPGLDSQGLQRQEQDVLLLQLGTYRDRESSLQRHHHGAEFGLAGGDFSSHPGRNLGHRFRRHGAISRTRFTIPLPPTSIPAAGASCNVFPGNVIPEEPLRSRRAKILA